MTQVTVSGEHMFLLKMAELPDSSGTSAAGRPSVELDLAEVNQLISMGFTKTKIAEILGISRKTLYNWISGQPAVVTKFSDIDDTQLDSAISSIKRNHPNDGEVMIKGHLLQKRIRVARCRVSGKYSSYRSRGSGRKKK